MTVLDLGAARTRLLEICKRRILALSRLQNLVQYIFECAMFYTFQTLAGHRSRRDFLDLATAYARASLYMKMSF